MTEPSLAKLDKVLREQGLGSKDFGKELSYMDDNSFVQNSLSEEGKRLLGVKNNNDFMTGVNKQVISRFEEETNGLLNKIDENYQLLSMLSNRLEPFINHNNLESDKELEKKDKKIESVVVDEIIKMNDKLKLNNKIINELLKGLQI